MLTAIVLCLLAGPPAAEPAPRADANPAAGQEIRDLEFRLAGLLMRGEIETYSGFLAEDYTRITDKGEVQARDEVLRQFAAAPTGASMEPGDLDVKVYGDTAILTGVLKVTPAGASAPARTSRFRKVFIRRHGRWYMVSLQGARLTP